MRVRPISVRRGHRLHRPAAATYGRHNQPIRFPLDESAGIQLDKSVIQDNIVPRIVYRRRRTDKLAGALVRGILRMR